MPQQGTQYQPDEYVLAYHGPLLYDARILLAENWTETNTLLGSTGPHYFIHYKSWKQAWDEWVPESRIVKLNDESKQLRRRLLQAQTSKGSAGGGTAIEKLKEKEKDKEKDKGKEREQEKRDGKMNSAAATNGTANGDDVRNGSTRTPASNAPVRDGAAGAGNGADKGSNSPGAASGTANGTSNATRSAGAEGSTSGIGNGMDIDSTPNHSSPPAPGNNGSSSNTTSATRPRASRGRAAASSSATTAAPQSSPTDAGPSKGNGNGNGNGNAAAGPSRNGAGHGPTSASGSGNGGGGVGKGKDGTAQRNSAGAVNGSGAGAAPVAGSGSGSEKMAGRKRAREAALEAELAASARRPEVKIVIPDVLKLQLVDDWENVTKHNQLVTLPRTPNVRQLLSEYRQYVEDTKQDRSIRSTSLLNEIISGITLYFDKALGNNLLYRFERAQYVEQTRRYGGGPGGAAAAATTSGSSSAPATGSTQGPASMGAGAGAGEKRAMSEIYGAEHLLRLFVNFGPFISYTNIDSESLNILRECINDIMKWMIKEQKRLFIKEYETTSMQYQTLSRT